MYSVVYILNEMQRYHLYLAPQLFFFVVVVEDPRTRYV